MLNHVSTLMDILDDPAVTGKDVVSYLDSQAGAAGSGAEVTVADGSHGATDFVRLRIPGHRGHAVGGDAPTLGVIGRLGGVGARPDLTGLVSDADGAVSALAVAAKLVSMRARGDVCDGDVLVNTHVCPDAPTEPREPVPMMNSPVDMATMNTYEVHDEMAAVVSIDTTKGNRVINHKGVALSPTVRGGYVLPVSDQLGQLLETVTGQPLVTYPVSTQDITPYGNGLHHINSILQPATATSAPVVGVAITSAATVAGCATGASHEVDIAAAARYAVEVAKHFGAGTVTFHDEAEFAALCARYGSMTHLQTMGSEVNS